MAELHEGADDEEEEDGEREEQPVDHRAFTLDVLQRSGVKEDSSSPQRAIKYYMSSAIVCAAELLA